MTPRACARERDVQQAAASGRWTPELRHHAGACADCRDVAAIAALLAHDAPPVPSRVSPVILFAKARHERRRRAETLALRIVVVGQAATAVIGLAGLAWLGARAGAWQAVESTLGAGLLAAAAGGGAAIAGLLVAGRRWLRHQ